MGLFGESLKQLGRRIGRSKKVVEGAFEEAETFVPKAKGGYGALSDVRPKARPKGFERRLPSVDREDYTRRASVELPYGETEYVPTGPPASAAEETGVKVRKINRRADLVGRRVEPGEPVDFRSTVKSGGMFGVWEEPPVVKKTVGLTDAQWQRYLQRIADKTPSQSATRPQTSIGAGGVEQTQQVPLTQGAEAATQAMSELQPEQTRLFARLREPYVEEGVKRYKNYDLPYTEAVEKYSADQMQAASAGLPKGKYEPFEQYLPPADVMSIGKGGETTFERRKFQPVGKRVDTAIENIRKALPQLQRKGKKIETPTDASELVKMSMVVDNMWKFIGGMRSIEGKMWQRLSQNAPGRKKAAYKGGSKIEAIDPRKYFNRTALKWLQDKKSVRDIEGKMLEEIWERYNKSM